MTSTHIAPPMQTGTTTMTLGKALNAGLRRAMQDDDRVLVMGEDVGTLGGVFRITDGLQRDFGSARVIDSPLAESAIVGSAIGLALRGFRPVCEIQFDGFVYPAFSQIVSQLAKMRARSSGLLAMPVVIRIPVGGGVGAVEHHSESNEAYFAHTAGLRAAMERDPKVVLMGEDIGKLGGVFRVTEGLQKDFGEERVIDTPLAESGIIGTAVGLAMRGYRPVC